MATFNIESVDAPQYAPGRPSRVELRRQHVVRGYLLRLLYALRVTGGTGTGRIFDDAWARLVRHVSLKIGGRDVISVSGQFLALYNYIFGREEWPQLMPEGLDAGTQDGLLANLYIPLHMIGSNAADAFAMPSAILPVGELLVTWGDAEDLATGEDGLIEVVDAVPELYEEFHTDPAMAPQMYQGLRMSQYTREVSQSGPVKIQLSELEAGDEIRAVFVEALAGGSLGADYDYSDDVVQTVRLSVSGRPVRDRVPADLVQDQNVVDYRLPERRVGLYVLDGAPQGDTSPGAMWTVQGRTTPTVEIDAVKADGECLVRVTTVYVRGRLGG